MSKFAGNNKSNKSMKKVMMLTVMMLTVIAVSAGKWYKTEQKGDELLGTQTQVFYVYQDTIDGDVRKFAFSDKDRAFSISTEKTLFKANPFIVDLSNNLVGTKCTIGLYDEQGNLLYTYKDYTGWMTNLYRIVTFTSKKKKTQEDFDNILEYVTTREGFIRIVAVSYKEDIYSLRVPCFNSRNKKMW